MSDFKVPNLGVFCSLRLTFIAVTTLVLSCLGAFVMLIPSGSVAGTLSLARPTILTQATTGEPFLTSRIEILEGEQLFQAGQIRTLRAMLGSIFCKVQNLGPTGGFCLDEAQTDVGGNSYLDHGVATTLASGIFFNQSVLDVGCGVGHYGSWFAKNKTTVRWEGVDGAENIEAVTRGHVKFADLTEPLRLPKHDWVFSLEVGEHLPEQFVGIFVDNLCHTATKGVVVSWARPGQGGHHHVNELPFEEVTQMFLERGMQPDNELGAALRKVATYPWLRNNIQVFRWPAH